jgi:hypothetical protein
LFFKDFSTGETGTVVHVIMKLYNVSYKEALSFLSNDEKEKYTHNNMQTNYTQTEEPPKPLDTYDYVADENVSKFNYFNQFGIQKHILLANGAKAIKKIIVKDSAYCVQGYVFDIESLYDDTVGQKFYFPEIKAKIGKKEYKHLHKKRADHVFGFWTVENSSSFKYASYPFLCEGEKDCLTLQSHGFPCITLGSQSNKFNDLILQKLQEAGVNHIYVCFDNDREEEGEAQKRCDELSKVGIKTTRIYIPKLEGVKDVSDYVQKGNDLIELLSCYL